MPTYSISPHEFDFSRSLALIDSGVLVAAFLRGNSRYDDMRTFLFEEIQGQLVVPISVAVETWGNLVGSFKSKESGVEFLAWLSDPGKVTVIPQTVNKIDMVRDMANLPKVDLVDALLMYLADEITEQCELRPPILIVTLDTRDYFNGFAKGLRYGILFPETPNDPVYMSR